ncbi:hypothetical protein K2X40_05195 [Candidatus Babeliales bacterium]|nr:hypothetical protein [Candidatus Babeliales bacterium]
MQIQKNTICQTIEQKFHHGFRWNFWGSIFYEAAKIVHHFFLLKFVNVTDYGLIGSMFAVIYMTTKLADFGMSHALAPFFCQITKNKKSFKKILLSYYLGPQLPIIMTAGFTAMIFFKGKFLLGHTAPYLFIIPAIVFLETIRSFLRYVLHMAFQSKTVVLFEIITFIFYLSSIWLALLGLRFPLSLNVIFIPHIFDSAFVTGVFLVMTYQYYQKLPTDQVASQPVGLGRRILNARVFNYFIRISREFFTSHFLTPFFAIKFGFKQAGLFYFASIIATAIQSIVKVSIGYSGNALFANLKEKSQEAKKQAFRIINEKLMRCIAPLIIILVINHKSIIKLGMTHNNTCLTIALLLLLLIIIFTEFFFMAYEQFYIIEEASRNLFIFKLFEFATFYWLIIASDQQTMLATLVSIIVIRLISFAVITINAYSLWQITPSLSTSKRYLAFCTVCAFMLLFVFKLQ